MRDDNPISVLIVDDHAMVREGLKVFLSEHADIEVTSEAKSGEEALGLCSESPPDVVLMDLNLPDMDGISAMGAILARYPTTRVIALASHVETRIVQDALGAGATSYLIRDVNADSLARAIRATHAGCPTYSPEVTEVLINPSWQPEHPKPNLTDRESEVLHLLAEGLSNNQIAVCLSISAPTVNYHVMNILSKLGVSNRTQAASLAVKYRLVS